MCTGKTPIKPSNSDQHRNCGKFAYSQNKQNDQELSDVIHPVSNEFTDKSLNLFVPPTSLSQKSDTSTSANLNNNNTTSQQSSANYKASTKKVYPTYQNLLSSSPQDSSMAPTSLSSEPELPAVQQQQQPSFLVKKQEQTQNPQSSSMHPSSSSSMTTSISSNREQPDPTAPSGKSSLSASSRLELPFQQNHDPMATLVALAAVTSDQIEKF